MPPSIHRSGAAPVALCRCTECTALDRARPGEGHQLALPGTTPAASRSNSRPAQASPRP